MKLMRQSYQRKLISKLVKPSNPLPIITISNATFYRHHPNSQIAKVSNLPLFQNLNFEISSAGSLSSCSPKFWAIVGPSSSGKTTLLQVLRGQHLVIPPSARSYPLLESEGHLLPSQAIKHVGFDGEQGIGANAPQTAYLSARYESRREEGDFSVLQYLQGNTELNPLQDIGGKKIDPETLERVIADLRLGDLVNMPVSNLSNGQTRRARIAKALLSDPDVLLLDEPFMGLDPPTLRSLSPMLYDLAEKNSPRLVLALRPQDPIPGWITHLAWLKGNCEIDLQGPKDEVIEHVRSRLTIRSSTEIGRVLTELGVEEPNLVQEAAETEFSPVESPASERPDLSRDGYPLTDAIKEPDNRPESEALVEMEGARVTYGTKSVLGNWTEEIAGSKRDGLWWTVRRGERWGIFGPNGSGKTTLLSLICSDHPQTYSLPIRLFGHPRIPEPGQQGVSIFDIQARIGHSSPEIHTHIPKSLTLRKVLANAWSDTFKGVPKLDDAANERIDACLRWFEYDLRLVSYASTADGVRDPTARPDWADDQPFGGLPFSAQRVALFLRAIIKHPDLVILDEAFSGMDDGVRDRCLLFLAHGETKRLCTSTSQIIDSKVAKAGRVTIGGLNENQALVCISHVREEIPGSVREWICLPEANTGEPARFGRLDGPIEGNYERWNEIWGMQSGI